MLVVGICSVRESLSARSFRELENFRVFRIFVFVRLIRFGFVEVGQFCFFNCFEVLFVWEFFHSTFIE